MISYMLLYIYIYIYCLASNFIDNLEVFFSYNCSYLLNYIKYVLKHFFYFIDIYLFINFI